MKENWCWWPCLVGLRMEYNFPCASPRASTTQTVESIVTGTRICRAILRRTFHRTCSGKIPAEKARSTYEYMEAAPNVEQSLDAPQAQ